MSSILLRRLTANTLSRTPAYYRPLTTSTLQNEATLSPIPTPPPIPAAAAAAAAAAAQPSPSSTPASTAPIRMVRYGSDQNKVNYTLPKVKAGAQSVVSKSKTVVYPLITSLNLVKALANAPFDETVSMTIRLNLDPRKPNQSVRGAASLPNGTGKSVRVAVFAKGEKAQEAKAAGADIVGEKDLVDAILAGKIDFDRCIATPDMMSFVGRVARILGPRGLMPNPKVGTVTSDVMAAVKSSKMGSVEFKTDKTGVIAVPIGKASFTPEQLFGNIEAFVEKIVELKPSGATKGAYILSAHVASTQGPGVPIDIKAHPFGKANTSTSNAAAAAGHMTGRYAKMHSVDGFDVIRYDLGSFPSKSTVDSSRGKWSKVIETVKSARKENLGWADTLAKVDAVNKEETPKPKKAPTPTAKKQ